MRIPAMIVLLSGVLSCTQRAIAPDAECGARGQTCCSHESCAAGLTCLNNTCTVPGAFGDPCTRNADCDSASCLPLSATQNVCTKPCLVTRDCVAGWTCGGASGARVCQCTPTAEVCDGLDNDCNGVVDDAAANDACLQDMGPRHTCLAGICRRSCSNTGDCLLAEVCDPATLVCEASDGGPSDAGQSDGGSDAGALDAGPIDGGAPDAGATDAGAPCTQRYDCDFGDTCRDGVCWKVALGDSCAQDAQCGRGQTCNFSHQCEAGCIDQQDCRAPQTCSTTRFQCESCSPSNPCPSGQLCAPNPPHCITAESCTTSPCVTAGAICSNMVCANCTNDAQCASAPYGGGYICSAGLCVTGCNVQQCQVTCSAQGLTCNTTACQCDQPSTSDCSIDSCPSGQQCLVTPGSTAGCAPGTTACATACSAASCPGGWDCIDLGNSQCTRFGLSTGSYCMLECSVDADCPGTASCCPTQEGVHVCSPFGPCITM